MVVFWLVMIRIGLGWENVVSLSLLLPLFFVFTHTHQVISSRRAKLFDPQPYFDMGHLYAVRSAAAMLERFIVANTDETELIGTKGQYLSKLDLIRSQEVENIFISVNPSASAKASVQEAVLAQKQASLIKKASLSAISPAAKPEKKRKKRAPVILSPLPQRKTRRSQGGPKLSFTDMSDALDMANAKKRKKK